MDSFNFEICFEICNYNIIDRNNRNPDIQQMDSDTRMGNE